MKKYVNLKSIIAAVFVFIGITMLIVALMPASGSKASDESSGNTVSETEEVYSYMVKSYNGNVCVFEYGNEDAPYISTEIKASSLRYVDYMDVTEGIKVNSFESALMLLEDFGS